MIIEVHCKICIAGQLFMLYEIFCVQWAPVVSKQGLDCRRQETTPVLKPQLLQLSFITQLRTPISAP